MCRVLVADGRHEPSLKNSRTGGRMRPDSAPKAWRALFEGGPLDGMPYIELESLRHTHVTLAVAGGRGRGVGRGELVRPRAQRTCQLLPLPEGRGRGRGVGRQGRRGGFGGRIKGGNPKFPLLQNRR